MRRLAALLLPLAATACLSRPPLVAERFAFAPPPAAAAPDPSARLVVAVPAADVAATFDRTGLVYRTGDATYEVDAYARLAASPRELVAEAVRERLKASGLFRDVTRRAGSGTAVVARLEVTELYGDFRAKEPAAVLSVRASLARAGAPPEGAVERTYVKRVPIAQRRPADLVGGWDVALGKVAEELGADLRELLASD